MSARTPPGAARGSTTTLRYDSDCAFCTASARIVEARSGGRVRIEATPGIASAELDDGRGAHHVRRGGAAVTGALATGDGSRAVRVVARLLDAPVLRLARDGGYALAARSRWLLSRLAK